MRAKRMIWMALIVPALLYALLCLALYLGQEAMLFFPRPNDPACARALAGSAITIRGEGGNLSGWLVAPERRPVVLYFGGNAEDVCAAVLDLRALGHFGVAAFNYRGYGGSEGKPTQAGLLGDAETIHAHLTRERGIDPRDIAVMGRSLGSGVALHLASERPVRSLVLIAPYDSVREVAKAHYPFVPVGPLLRHPFDSMRRIRNLDAPMLMLTGSEDRVIPNRHSDRLFRAYRGPKRRVRIDEAGHNDLHLRPAYREAIVRHLRRVASREAETESTVP